MTSLDSTFRAWQSRTNTPRMLLTAKLILIALCLALTASHVTNMTRWSERSGVYDDICYLRQAHLFQRFGLGGFDTDVFRDDDQYFKMLSREIGIVEWNEPRKFWCHVDMSSGKRVLQYPPGTGLLLSIFPEGRQVFWLYATVTVLVAVAALTAIMLAKSVAMAWLVGIPGLAAIYLMINPGKSSFSIGPTMLICAAAGFLIARMFQGQNAQSRLLAAIASGLLLGLSVNLRLANLFLAAGCSIWLLIDFLRARDGRSFVKGLAFGSSYVLGIMPVLYAQWINAGSPFATTYGGGDTQPADWSFSIFPSYAGDTQAILLLIAILWTAVLMLKREVSLFHVSCATAINLVVNIVFFLSHPVFTPYYMMPIAMLSMWTLIFASVAEERRTKMVAAPA